MSSLSRSIRRQAPAAEAQRQAAKHYTKAARGRHARRQAALDERLAEIKRNQPPFTDKQADEYQALLDRVRKEMGY